MKKWYLVATILATVLLAIGCAPPKPIPPAAISEIYAMSDAEVIRDYVEVQTVSDRPKYGDRADYCYIMIYIKSPLGEFTTLEDALPHAKTYTESFIEAAVKILGRYDINKEVDLWAQIPLKEGGVTILGHTDYDGETFHDFELYEYK